MKIAMPILDLPTESKMSGGYIVHAMANAYVRRGHYVCVFSPCAKPDNGLYDYRKVDAQKPLRTFRFAWNLRKIDFSGFDIIHAQGDDYWLWGKHFPFHIRTMHGSCLVEAFKISGVKNKLRMLLLYGSEILATLVADKTVCVSKNTIKYYPWLKTVIPNGVDVASFAAMQEQEQKSDSGNQNLETNRSVASQNNMIIDHCSLINEKYSMAKCPQPQSTQSAKSVDDSCPVSVTSSETISPNSSPSVSSVSSVAKSSIPTILFVGTYGNRKRGKLLIEIFARDILPKLPAAQLWMVCSDAPPAANVSVLGRISQQELINRYRRAWAFCLPSTYEGFGIPYIEAMAAGTAVVASPNVGAVEVTRNGQDGLVVADDKLGQTLLQVLTDETLRHKLEAAGLERVKDFDLNKVCEQYEEIYTGLIKKNNPSTDYADDAD